MSVAEKLAGPEQQRGAGRGFRRSLPMALLRAREAVMTVFRPHLREQGLTEQQWRVLRALSDAQSLEAGELARRCCLLPPSLSRIIASMAEAGYVSRRAAPDDHRHVLVTLMEPGRAQLARGAPHSLAGYAFMEERFGAERLNRLMDELQALSEALGEPPPPEAE